MSLVGLDIGTTGCKAIVFDVRGQVLGQALREYDVLFPAPDRAEQDAERVWQLAWAALEEALSAARVLKALEEVDPSRVGLTGFSLGGNAAWYGMACDLRIRTAVAMCGGIYTDIPLSTVSSGKKRVDVRELYDVEKYLPKVRHVAGKPMFLY